jgi:EAL domain-containing protein (putative c-di-GMP-specific phosphodiesterase class I)
VRVVAEGVETAGEAAALRTLGVDYGQGWHYGRPGPPEALTAAHPARIPTPRTAQNALQPT